MRSVVAVCGVTAALALAACSAPDPASAEPSASATKSAVLDHHVGTRVVDGVGEFYSIDTGQTFTTRGFNYNHWVADPATGNISDALLSTTYWDASAVDADLAEIEDLGFNTIRVMVDVASPAYGAIDTGPTGRELNPAFLDNLTELLDIAQRHHLEVFLSSNTLPDGSWWINRTASHETPLFQGAANEFFTEVGVSTYVDYWTKIVEGLVDRGAATDSILGYELRQEYHVYANQPPFSLASGTVTTASGDTYDLSRPEEKDRLFDEGTAYWEDQIRTAIREIDPTALVTVGFFTPNDPHPVRGDDPRFVRTAYFLTHASADFIDIHHYPGNGVDDDEIWENFGLTGTDRMPVLLGEFGGIKEWFSNEADAAAAVMGLEVAACREGIDGYLVWAWRGDDLHDIFWASEGDGYVARVVSPATRPDACEYGAFDFLRYNAASTAVVTASSAIDGRGPEYLNDGTPALWNASARSPQWVQLDLAGPTTLDRIELVVAQDPPGPSTHELWMQTDGGALTRVTTYAGTTRENDVLVYEPDSPIVGVVQVRVVTTSLGDLWPAWHEIYLWSPDTPT